MKSLIKAAEDAVLAPNEKEREKALLALEEALAYHVDLDEDLDGKSREELLLHARALRVSQMSAHDRLREYQEALDEIQEGIRKVVCDNTRHRLEQLVCDQELEVRADNE